MILDLKVAWWESNKSQKTKLDLRSKKSCTIKLDLRSKSCVMRVKQKSDDEARS